MLLAFIFVLFEFVHFFPFQCVQLFYSTIILNDITDKKANSPHIAITGPTVSGKSYLAKFIFFLSVLMNGKGLYVDPKSEFFNRIMEVINHPLYYDSILKNSSRWKNSHLH
ncbi:MULTISPECIES: ATP-binding protein [Enterococcus]|uniref:ATP-binding protein n=1 Tax=Enterococcus TaxID=1350 RepID=UPI00115C1585|nr:ATP-binding protein [Enterococcus faecalis]MBO6321612.1 hypothetical protein [Enterococcus faecalis]MBO6346964.1 hypothetical protein [Enterococcus faecalis]MBO6409256.1 hypothetical protein [Enterococcus faecalis]HAP4681743.1 hypothetical protein [Enterococcus faecalis]HAP4687776.1 hypothetical protein [Enterococcus faecalis]